MDGKLEGRVAVVTGAGSGIGREIARCFAAEGASVHILGRREENLAETRRLCLRPDRVRVHTLDLAQPAAIDQFLTVLRAGETRVHILVNNAGLLLNADFERNTPEAFDRVMAINLKAAFLLSRGMIPLLRAAGGAAIVNIASTLAYMPVPGASLYSISKAGLAMLTKSLALEFAAAGIRCNTISPGVVDTPVFESIMDPAQVPGHLQRMAAAHPLGRVGRPDEIARAALFLACDDSAWITGVNLPVDGGISLT